MRVEMIPLATTVCPWEVKVSLKSALCISDHLPPWTLAQRPSHWDGLCNILERSYWGRVWIIQELAVAQDVVFHCGFNTALPSKLKMIMAVMHRTSREVVSETANKVLTSGARFLKVAASITAYKSWHNEDQQGLAAHDERFSKPM
jgi:hypothetical protein